MDLAFVEVLNFVSEPNSDTHIPLKAAITYLIMNTNCVFLSTKNEAHWLHDTLCQR